MSNLEGKLVKKFIKPNFVTALILIAVLVGVGVYLSSSRETVIVEPISFDASAEGEATYVSNEKNYPLTVEQQAFIDKFGDTYPSGAGYYNELIQNMLKLIDQQKDGATEVQLNTLGLSYEAAGDKVNAIKYYELAKAKANNESASKTYNTIINRVRASSE